MPALSLKGGLRKEKRDLGRSLFNFHSIAVQKLNNNSIPKQCMDNI